MLFYDSSQKFDCDGTCFQGPANRMLDQKSHTLEAEPVDQSMVHVKS